LEVEAQMKKEAEEKAELERQEAEEAELRRKRHEEWVCITVYEPQSCFARLWLDSHHDNLPKGIRTIKMCI